MIVMKFGGTSVGSADRIKSVIDIVCQHEGPVVLVLSAVSGMTNALVELSETKSSDKAMEIILDIVDRFSGISNELGLEGKDFDLHSVKTHLLDIWQRSETDLLLSQGERITVKMVSRYLSSLGIPCEHMNALESLVLNEEGNPDMHSYTRSLRRHLAGGGIVLTEGFICRDHEGKVTNLGRGGSDLTASLAGAALDADEIQIWTDVSGMLTCDPRVVEKTRSIQELSFDEAAELAYFGAKVLHPRTVMPARQKNIPVRIKNTFYPDDHGTVITRKGSGPGLKAMAAKDGITVIKIVSDRMLMAHGFLARVFGVFDQFQTPIDMITTSEVAVSITIDNTRYLPEILDALSAYGQIEFEGHQTILSIVGDGITNDPGALVKATQALTDTNFRMLSFGGSPNNFSFLIPTENKEKALHALNDAFFAATESV